MSENHCQTNVCMGVLVRCWIFFRLLLTYNSYKSYTCPCKSQQWLHVYPQPGKFSSSYMRFAACLTVAADSAFTRHNNSASPRSDLCSLEAEIPNWHSIFCKQGEVSHPADRLIISVSSLSRATSPLAVQIAKVLLIRVCCQLCLSQCSSAFRGEKSGFKPRPAVPILPRFLLVDL